MDLHRIETCSTWYTLKVLCAVVVINVMLLYVLGICFIEMI
jgi:hypothetical protein